MTPGSLLEGEISCGPGLRVVRVDAKQLDAAGVDESLDRADHTVVEEVAGPPALGREDEHRASIVPIAENSSGGTDFGRVEFDHLHAQRIFGASVFAVRPSTALLATVDEFISYWQIKRDQSKRGIIEVSLEEAE